MTEKSSQFDLRAKERQTRRISRKKLMIVIQVLASVLIILIALSFWNRQSPMIEKNPSHISRNTQKPEGLEKLPQSYDYLGKKANGQQETPHSSRTMRTPSKATKEAHASGLFFQVSRKPVGNRQVINHKASSLSQDLSSLSSRLDHRLQGLNAETPEPKKDPNFQMQKSRFLATRAKTDTLSTHMLKAPPAPTMLMAGTIISASLLTGLNSDLPGHVMAQVTEPVYDTVTGNHLLIPQGARLLGRYDSMIAHGQKRALVVWNRLVLPNGHSVVLDNLPATDVGGYTGLRDQVDHHSFELIKGVALATVLNIGTGLAFRSNDSDLIKAIRESTQGTIETASDKIINQKLNIQPTLKVRPGWPLRILVRKDIVMRPIRINP